MYMQPQNNYFISFENVRIRMKEPHVLNWVFFGPLRIPAMPICLLVPCVQQGYTHYVGIILSIINASSIMPINYNCLQHKILALCSKTNIFPIFCENVREKYRICLLPDYPVPSKASCGSCSSHHQLHQKGSFSILTLTLGHWRIKTIIY